MNHELLMRITEDMPCRVIQVGGLPYLERYFAGHNFGGQVWLHRFLRGDSERHLHTHPFQARVMVLRGSYAEEIMDGPEGGRFRNQRYYRAGDQRLLYETTLHRVVEAETDTWTLLYVEPGRLPHWKFIDDDGAEKLMQSGGEDWWKHYGPRGRRAA